MLDRLLALLVGLLAAYVTKCWFFSIGLRPRGCRVAFPAGQVGKLGLGIGQRGQSRFFGSLEVGAGFSSG